MATTFDHPVTPFAGPFADLERSLLEASTQAMRASAELYTTVLSTQAEATRALLDVTRDLGGNAAETAVETTEQAEATATRAARTTARTTARTARRSTQRAASTTRRGAATTRRAAKPATQPEPPITGYDKLTAEEIVAKLPEQPQTTLVEIAAWEQAHDQRATVLQRVAALTGPEPAPGYDALNADDAQKLVTSGSAELAATVRDYERRHKDRASVIEAAVRHADAS
jgi:hypothetical protein